MQFGRLALRAGFVTVFSQLAMLASAVPSALLLPPDMVQQLVMTIPLMLILMLYGLPKLADRIFFANAPHGLERTGFGAICVLLVVLVGAGFVLLVTSSVATPFEAQMISLVSLFTLNMYIAARWLV